MGADAPQRRYLVAKPFACIHVVGLDELSCGTSHVGFIAILISTEEKENG